MKLTTLAPLAVSLVAIAIATSQATSQIKTFDPKETEGNRKTIEANYKVLHKAIHEEDADPAINVLHEQFSFINAISLPADPSTDDFGNFDSYLEEIGTGKTIGGFSKSNHPASSKIEGKITEFISGRRLSIARFVETLKDTFVDEEGQLGEKGKTINLESTSIYTDHWYFDVNGEDGNAWQLYDRELTSLEIKINGKPMNLNSDGTPQLNR